MVWLQFFQTFKSYFWELVFDNIIRGNCILNSNTDELIAAVNHKLFLLMPGQLGIDEDA